MKSKLLKLIGTFSSTLAVTFLLACGPARPTSVEAQAATPPAAVLYAAQPTGSSLKIDGTSTLHDWTIKTTIVGGSVEADAKFPESALTDAQAARPKVQAFVPVKSLKSGNNKMDSSTYEYLKEPQFKRIEWKLIELKPKSAAGSTGPLKFDAVGTLTIVGTTLTNTMPVTIEKTDGKIKIVGSTPIKCTDYGLKPYSFSILGANLASCGDDLKISFEWLLAPKAP